MRLPSKMNLLLVVMLSVLVVGCGGETIQRTEILWDTWGVPHIYSPDEEGLFRAFGWAQMKSHGDLLLKLYGESRGRASEYWGEENLDTDRYVRTMGIPERARRWYEAQSPEFRRYLDAFAAGMNEYAEQHPEALAEERRVVLPIDAIDVLAHTQRAIHFTFVSGPDAVAFANKALEPPGSNSWAIGPSRAAGGRAMLLINPHLPWNDLYLFYEAHMVGPGMNFYGATLVGFPILALGFNDRLGWTHTVNTYDGSDLYELTLTGDGYRWEGESRPFESEEQQIVVRNEDGTERTVPLTVQRSVHGPVIAQGDGRAVALRVAGLDQPGMLQEWWDMMRATSLDQFETTLKRIQIPMFNVVYADGDGRVFYLFNAREPARSGGDFQHWSHDLAPGDTAESLWTDTLPYDRLPRIVDPASGAIQNANDPPWTATDPPLLDPGSFPSYLAPQFMHFRAQRSARMQSDESITFEEMVGYKHSARMELADRLVDDLLEAARRHGGAAAREAAEVLEKWDRNADAGSRGAVLFYQWTREMGFEGLFRDGIGRYAEHMAELFATPWDPGAPHTTPDGLADPAAAAAALERAAAKIKEGYGDLSVEWGEVFRITYAEHDLPANGGPGDPLGLFRVLYFEPDEEGRFRALGGDTFYAVVEFSEPVRARVLMSYGNETQPGSPHRGDQLEMFANKEMRTPWLTREEIESHLESLTGFED